MIFGLPTLESMGNRAGMYKNREKGFWTGLLTLLLFLEISVDVFMVLDPFKKSFFRLLHLPARFPMLSDAGKPKIIIILI